MEEVFEKMRNKVARSEFSDSDRRNTTRPKDIRDSKDSSPGLRRSRSLSSAAFLVSEPVQAEFSSLRFQSRSPYTSGVARQQRTQSSRRRAFTPERHQVKQFDVPTVQNIYGLGKNVVERLS